MAFTISFRADTPQPTAPHKQGAIATSVTSVHGSRAAPEVKVILEHIIRPD